MLTLQVADNRPGDCVAAGDGFNHKSRSKDAVSGSKYSFPGSSKCIGIDGDGILIRDANTSIIRDECQPGSLADSEDHGITFQEAL